MNEKDNPQTPEQLRYARWLDIFTRIGLLVLVLSFAVYVLGLAPPMVAPEKLPALWTQPVAQYLAATGAPTGWQWVRALAQGDMAALLGIVLLVGCSMACLLAVLPFYWRRRDRAFVALVLAELATMALAASGVLGGGH